MIRSVSEEQFDAIEMAGQFLYVEEYAGNSRKYGMLLADLIECGKSEEAVSVLISNVALARMVPSCAYVYLVPPSLAELERRLQDSGRLDWQRAMDYNKKEVLRVLQEYHRLDVHLPHLSILCCHTDQLSDCAAKVLEIVRDGSRFIEVAEVGGVA